MGNLHGVTSVTFLGGSRDTSESVVWDTVTACPTPIGYACIETNWYTMHAADDCGNPSFLPSGTCFWISELSGSSWTASGDHILDRDCVVELDPTTNCSEIEIECGDPAVEVEQLALTALQACPSTSACPTGESYWWTLTVDSVCENLPAGKCVWINVTGPVLDRDCDEAFDLNCFAETSETGTIDCNQIEKVCGDEEIGPSGCPDCD